MIKEKFSLWTENGRFYYKTEGSNKVKEISEGEFTEISNENTVTSIKTESLSTKTNLKELLDKFKKDRENNISEFGRRIKVIATHHNQIKAKNGGVDVEIELKILNEEIGLLDNDMYKISLKLEGMTGSYVDKGLYIPEIYRALYQLAFNGCLATNNDAVVFKTAMKGEV